MKMINQSNSDENSWMVATRDPPLSSRPKSTSQDANFRKPKKWPIPHRDFAASNTAQPSAEPRKCCFPCFPLRQQRAQHKDVTKNTTSGSPLEINAILSGSLAFDYAALEKATNNFDPSRELGRGGFGSVYSGVFPFGFRVAVKKVYEKDLKPVEHFWKEVRILTQLKHQNLVTLYGCTSRRSRKLLLVYKYIPNGTVAYHLHGERTESRLQSWPFRLGIAVETAEALVYLHKSGTIHQNVKTNNILLDYDFSVKVADFGLSSLFTDEVTDIRTAPRGTPGYMDPEYRRCKKVSDKIDVFSFGVVLIELISSQKALDFKRQLDDIFLSSMAINKIQNGTLRELVDANLGFETDSNVRRMVTSVAELAFLCLQHESDTRPSMEQVLETLKRIQSHEFEASPLKPDISP